MSQTRDNPWLCACPKCKAARQQLQRCQLKEKRDARSRRIITKLEARAQPEYSDRHLETAVGRQLRKYQEAGLGPALAVNLVYDLGLNYDDLERVVAALENFMRKGWVIEFSYPKGVANPTRSYKLVK